jgi:Anaphase-promoting complex, cyclosome, subunit 3
VLPFCLLQSLLDACYSCGDMNICLIEHSLRVAVTLFLDACNMPSWHDACCALGSSACAGCTSGQGRYLFALSCLKLGKYHEGERALEGNGHAVRSSSYVATLRRAVPSNCVSIDCRAVHVAVSLMQSPP